MSNSHLNPANRSNQKFEPAPQQERDGGDKIDAFCKKEFKGIFDQSLVNTNQDYSIVDKIKKIPDIRAAEKTQRFSQTGQGSGGNTKYGQGTTLRTKGTFGAAAKETLRGIGLKMNKTSDLTEVGHDFSPSGGPGLVGQQTLEAQKAWAQMQGQQHQQQQQSRIMGPIVHPTNQEILAAQYGQMMGQSPSQYNFADFMQKNIGDLKTFKSKTLQDTKQRIEFIHGKLRSKNNLAGDLLELQAIEQHLPQHLRQQFMSMPHHGPLLRDLQDLNASFIPVLDFLCSYKTEFGVMLQRMIEAYNIILLMQFEGFYKNDNAKSREYEDKLIQLSRDREGVLYQKHEFDTQKQMSMALIESKDKVIKDLMERNELLEEENVRVFQDIRDSAQQIEHLKSNSAAGDWKDQRLDEVRNLRSADSAASRSSQQSSSAKISSDSESNGAPSETSQQLHDRVLDEFNESIDDSKKTIAERAQNLNNLQKIVSRALRKGNCEMGCQTDPVDFGTDIQSLGLGSQAVSGRGSATQRGTQFKRAQGMTTNMTDNIMEDNQSIGASTIGHPQTAGSGDYQRGPVENSNALHGKTALEMGGVDKAKISELNKRLTSLLMKPIKGNLAKNQQKDALDIGKYTWSNPAFVCLFLQGAIEKYTNDPADPHHRIEELKMKIISWPDFKTQIYEIYDHRILHAPEINGAINTTYMTLDEHMLLFFVEKYKTRPKIENGIIEFLSTLKYYAETWERAKVYAQLTGFQQHNEVFLHVKDKTGTGLRLNDGEIDECDVPIIDMYLQEFFFHAYSMLKKDGKFIESKEGCTYLKQNLEERISSKLLTFIPAQEQGKWSNKIKRNLKKTKVNDLDDFDTEFIDIDTLLSMYNTEFREAKRQNQDKIKKNFARIVQEAESRNEVTLDNAKDVVYSVRNNKALSSYVVTFPSHIATLRALVYAYMCGTNQPDLNEFEFLAGCNRFAIDNPTPTITKRMAFYGNIEEVSKGLDGIVAKVGEQPYIKEGMYTGIQVAQRRGGDLSMPGGGERKEIMQDFNETSVVKKPKNQKFAAVQDLTMLALSIDGKEFEAPAEKIIDRNVEIKIKDLQKAMKKSDSQVQTAGLTSDNKFEMTSLEVGIQGEKQLIVPTFGKTSALFIRHFEILRQLRRRISLLQQAYKEQFDEKRSWKEVDEIIEVLERGINFLGFDDVIPQIRMAVNPDGDSELQPLYEDEYLDQDEAAREANFGGVASYANVGATNSLLEMTEDISMGGAAEGDDKMDGTMPSPDKISKYSSKRSIERGSQGGSKRSLDATPKKDTQPDE